MVLTVGDFYAKLLLPGVILSGLRTMDACRQEEMIIMDTFMQGLGTSHREL
jgi:hypothetical protein